MLGRRIRDRLRFLRILAYLLGMVEPKCLLLMWLDTLMVDNMLGFQWIFRLWGLYWDGDRAFPNEPTLHVLTLYPFVSRRLQTFRLERWDAQFGCQHFSHSDPVDFFSDHYSMFWRASWCPLSQVLSTLAPLDNLLHTLDVGHRGTTNCGIFCLLIQLDKTGKWSAEPTWHGDLRGT